MYLPNGRIRKFRRSSEDPGCAHELTFSCYRRLALLSRTRTRQWLIESLAAARQKHQFDLWAYVIMPEHVHVLIVPRNSDYRVGSILQSIKQPVMRKALTFLRGSNSSWLSNLTNPNTGEIHFWQPGGGYDRNVTTPETAWNVVEYLHQNPVKRGLVDSPLDWAWSSGRWYAGEGEVLLPMDGIPPKPNP